ncbi:DUF6221 family protein [Streptomyces spinosisporus]|uniref:DUF6221 family protein n=1 Tax=Streptomyces spinosisporus TaxID=2927582 RepID=A0ABS9XY68_9ACTN|nr:DUF6221 family protein [Streptomyces spinosisporus]MCI3246291.1 DUF6221 family protein [Streptomyces spinosisporus]
MPSQGELIAAFLRARYMDAREAEASRRSIPGNLPFRWTHVFEWNEEFVLIEGLHRAPAKAFYRRYGQPAADPAVLADLDAKLAVLDEHQDVNDGDCDTCVDGQWGYPTHGSSSPQRHPCRTLRHLAVPFAAHPDYDERWRP